MKRLYCEIKKCYLHVKKKCIFRSRAKTDRKTFFEGRNLLDKNSELLNSRIGYASYLGEGSKLRQCRIGRYTSIGPAVSCVIGKHPINFVSTHPSFFSLRKQVGFTYVNEKKYDEFEPELYEGYSISIGNDVWIGAGATLKEGICISDGAVIGAGTLVLQDVPPYAIVGGVPAKVIRYRFEKEDVDFLLKLKWWDKEEAWIKDHADYFENIDELKKQIENEKS